MYALRFGKALLKVGQTTNRARARGTSGYTFERSLYGKPVCMLQHLTNSRLEDEDYLLSEARFLFGKPCFGREWFSCGRVTPDCLEMWALVLQCNLRGRMWSARGSLGLRVRLQNLAEKPKLNRRRGLVVGHGREGRLLVILTGGRCVSVSPDCILHNGARFVEDQPHRFRPQLTSMMS